MRRVRVFVMWSGDPAGTSAEVEITRTPYNIPVVSNDTSVVRVMRDGFVIGVAPGVAQISSTASPGTTPYTISVSPSPQQQPTALLIIYRGTPQWAGTTTGTTAPKLLVGLPLSQEQDSHTILAVSESTGMLLNLSSLSSSHPTDYGIAIPSTTPGGTGVGYAWAAYVPVDARRIQCQDLVLSGFSASHNVSSRNVDVPVPSITGIAMCCTNAVRLTPAGETAMIATGYAQTSYSGFSSTVYFGDGTNAVITTDSRTTYEVIENTCGGVLMNGNRTVLSVSTQGTISIRARFKGFTSTAMQLQCVVTTGITPSFSLLGAGTISTNLIRRINCSPVFQSGRARYSLAW